MARFRIRASLPSDAPVLAQIWRQAAEFYADMDPAAFQIPALKGLVDWFEELLAEAPVDTACILVAEVEGHVVGAIDAVLHEASDDAHRQMVRSLGETRVIVNNLMVARSARRAGVGRALMGAVEDWGKQRGAILVTLDTYSKSPVSVPFYERLGYARHAIVFQKRL